MAELESEMTKVKDAKHQLKETTLSIAMNQEDLRELSNTKSVRFVSGCRCFGRVALSLMHGTGCRCLGGGWCCLSCAWKR